MLSVWHLSKMELCVCNFAAWRAPLCNSPSYSSVLIWYCGFIIFSLYGNKQAFSALYTNQSMLLNDDLAWLHHIIFYTSFSICFLPPSHHFTSPSVDVEVSCEWQRDETSQWQTAHWVFIDWLSEQRLQEEEEELPLFVTHSTPLLFGHL